MAIFIHFVSFKKRLQKPSRRSPTLTSQLPQDTGGRVRNELGSLRRSSCQRRSTCASAPPLTFPRLRYQHSPHQQLPQRWTDTVNPPYAFACPGPLALAAGRVPPESPLAYTRYFRHPRTWTSCKVTTQTERQTPKIPSSRESDTEETSSRNLGFASLGALKPVWNRNVPASSSPGHSKHVIVQHHEWWSLP